ncbi:MAG: hypothetical protein WBL41_21615, partial [Terracidiphilus sp.]
FNRVTGPETGLTPDRNNFDGTPVVGRDGTPVPSGDYRYYDGMLYLMSMMHASGEFRVIEGKASSR